MNSTMLSLNKLVLKEHFIILMMLIPLSSYGQFSSPFKITYSAKTSGNLPYVEIQVSEVADADEFGFSYSFTDYQSGNVISTDSTLLPNQNSQVFNNVLIHRISSPNGSKEIALNFKLSYQGKDLIQQGILMPLSDEKLGFRVKNISNPKGLNYIKAGDQIMLESKEDKTVYLYKLQQEFWASAPPMINATVANNPSVNIERVVQMQTNKIFTLQDPALYFAQIDTTSQLGIGIKVTSSDFPKLRKIKHVIEPMRYISTQSETKVLTGVSEPKEELDKFWLNLGGSPDNAKKVIKRYFQRVSYANHNFTGYKQGWKTDMGLIYIIFGNPNRIVTTTDQVQWIYQSSGGESTVQFDFKKKKNQFSGYHYELIRDSRYKSTWNSTIALWRNGLVR